MASKANPSEMEQIAGVFWGENSSKNEQLEFQSHPFGKGKTTLLFQIVLFWVQLLVFKSVSFLGGGEKGLSTPKSI